MADERNQLRKWVGVSTVAAIVGSTVQSRRERRRRREQAAFGVFMLLLELKNQYFWVASAELRGEQCPSEVRANAKTLAWRIRETDDVQYLEEILKVLMDEDAYGTANDRAKALDAVIAKLGADVNPRYAKIIESISASNILGFLNGSPGHQNNAPGLFWP